MIEYEPECSPYHQSYMFWWIYYNWEQPTLSANSALTYPEFSNKVNNLPPLLISPGGFWPSPDISKAAFVAPNATVVGQVEIDAGASIWYGAVVRGDIDLIKIGACSNVQDGAVLHGDPGRQTVLEDYVTIGHRAVIHSAYIERGSLIGIGAIILSGVRVGAGSIVGAGSVVTKDVPPGSLVIGIPGKIFRPLSEAETAELIEHAKHYRQLGLVHAGKGEDLGFPGVEGAAGARGD